MHPIVKYVMDMTTLFPNALSKAYDLFGTSALERL